MPSLSVAKPAVALREGGSLSVAVKLADADRPTIIRLKDVKKIYDIGTPRETQALRGIDLEISLAEIVVIFGTSGSGKSTMLNILAGLDTATSGTVEVDGKNLTQMKPHELALYHQYKVGMVFQSYNLVPTFTVMQNITMPARLAGFKRATYLQRGRDLLKQFDLEKLLHRLPSEISGGQAQRVGIMRAFMNRPSFIIADEPTGNLDSVNSEHIMELFKQLNTETNTTMMIVTHDSTLFKIADRVVHVLDGKIIKQTILTHKAKVDPDKVGVPVEYRYREEEKAEMIALMRAGKEAAVRESGQKQAADQQTTVARQQQEITNQLKVITRREGELQKMMQSLERQQQAVNAQRQRLDHERATIARQGMHAEHEREQIIVAELKLHQETALARQYIAAETKQLKRLEQRHAHQAANVQAELATKEQRLAAAFQELARLQQNVAREQQQLGVTRTDLHSRIAALEKEHAAARAAQAALEAEQQALFTRQQALDEQRRELDQQASHIEASEKQKLATARTALQQERHQLTTARTAFINEQRAFKQQLTDVEQKQHELTAEKAALQTEWKTLAARTTALDQRSVTTKQEQHVANEMRTMLTTKQIWLQTEAKRLQHVEQTLIGRETELHTAQNTAEAAWQAREQAALQKIAAAQATATAQQAKHAAALRTSQLALKAQQAELTLATDKLEAEQNRLLAMRQQTEQAGRELAAARTELQAKSKHVEAQQADLAARQAALEKKIAQQVSVARDIIDHEKEQLETERQQQQAQINARSQAMERKLAAARDIISREMTVIQEEHKLLQQERHLIELERQQIEDERKKKPPL